MNKWLITAGGVMAVAVPVLTFFGTYGWITRQAYAIDEQREVEIHENHADQNSIDELILEVKKARQEQKIYHDEWKCDEADESVIEIRVSMAEETDQRTKIILADNLKKTEEVRADLNCSQFTD